jgi:hypothetical protein
MRKTNKVVIVGAGPGGLAAAILLAQSGVEVTVVEKRSTVGGRTSTIEREGFKFDTGPTFFLYPRVLREIFAAAGRDLDAEVPMERLDPQYRLVFGSGGELLATPNLEKMEKAIAALCPKDAAGFIASSSTTATSSRSSCRFSKIRSIAGAILPSCRCSRCSRSCALGARSTPTSASISPTSASVSASAFNRSILACRPSPAPACSAFFPSLNTSMASFIRSAAVGR